MYISESASRPLIDFGDFWQSQFRDMMLWRKCVQEKYEKFKKKMKGRSPISKLVWWIQSRFNFNFRFEFEYMIHRTIKGDAFRWIFWLFKCFIWDDILERKHPWKSAPSQSFCTGSDHSSQQWQMFRSKSRWSSTRPDDSDLVTCECPEQPRSDDPALYRMIRTWEFQCVFSSFCRHPGWSEYHQKTHNGHFRGWEYIYPFTPFLLFSLSSRPTSIPKH